MDIFKYPVEVAATTLTTVFVPIALCAAIFAVISAFVELFDTAPLHSNTVAKLMMHYLFGRFHYFSLLCIEYKRHY
jgi:hypothetical protein